jgi:uncharacterized membrane protein YhaH (DUF805 family)
MNWYLAVLKNYTGFRGRASRTEFWMFNLVNFLVMLALWILYGAVHALGVLVVVYELGLLLPSLAVSVRRLHDTNRSGWWLLIDLIPLIGAIVLLIFLCTDSTSADNEYGPNPKVGLALA